jgi:hypothetical protein
LCDTQVGFSLTEVKELLALRKRIVSEVQSMLKRSCVM